MSRRLISGKTKSGAYRSLNDFIKASDFDVHTARARDKKGNPRGKYLLFNETVKGFTDEAISECKDKNSYDGKCETAIIEEDTPDYCLFGNRTCIHKSVKKEILNRKQIKTDEPEESETFYKLQTITDEELEEAIF